MQKSVASHLMLLVSVALLMCTLRVTLAAGEGMHKRSFTSLGCLGDFDKSKLARLDRVCEECYQLFREPDIQTMCREDCFDNETFNRCVQALMLTEEKPTLQKYINALSMGKK